VRNSTLIKPLRSGLSLSDTGNKANSLLYLHKFRFRIPSTYLIAASIYDNYLKNKENFLEELRHELLRLPDKSYAVRSSTTSEDSADFTYAGQFKTLTNISGADNLVKAIQEIWDSAFCCHETEYHKRTLKGRTGCAVIIQEMISSKLAGVSFSKNPLTNQQEIIIEAVEGPGEDLVQKGVTPFRWKFRKNTLIEGNRDYQHFALIKKVAADTSKLKRLFRNHVDIEWVFDGNHIYYLQFRHITGTRELKIYSNKLAKEMLPGQIKPLVWSINIPLVNGTWIKLLSEITGQLDIRPEDLAKSFYFRTYFNIAALSRIFMEFGLSTFDLEALMLGRGDSKPSFKPGFKTLRHTFRIVKFIHNKLTLEKSFLTEYPRLKTVYEKIRETIDAQFSLSNYPNLYSTLFENGKRLAYFNIVVPILMQIHNKRLSQKLKKMKVDYDLVDFNADFPELLTLSPLTVINKIRDKIEALPHLIRLECTSFEKMKLYPEAAEITSDIESFLKDFGHFSESGNDFSVPKWHENPEQVFRMILKTEATRSKSGLLTFSQLRKRNGRPDSGIKRTYLKAGRFKVYREQISSLFIFGHGLFRHLYLNIGKEFTKIGVIESAEDIFYLSREEIDKILEDTMTADIKTILEKISTRKKEYETTRDYVLPSVIYGDQAPVLEIGKKKNHYGVGTSSGVLTGHTKVINGPDDFDSVIKGDVLVIPFSDVSWTPILTLAGAIVSETGGLLSHCSIIAREMGIPALVSVENACSIGSGLLTTVDGSNGVLTIHDYE
jgi:phosphoenolpyruvate synthase/pyruvate phosphate dikinase